jgi:translation machinery-associated protein 16
MKDLIVRYVYAIIFLAQSHADICLARYINRSVPEIEQLQSERRKGRPPSKREEALLQRTEVENKEFKTGFWMPDLSQEDVIKGLASWNGDWSGLSMMKFIRITKDGGKQPSAFPPKGLS